MVFANVLNFIDFTRQLLRKINWAYFISTPGLR